MTVKELKEKLECLIEDGKEDYILIFDGLMDSDDYGIYADNERKEVWL
jgi:Ni,Fe-hydrogenase I small subunit|nr:MAG TPA: hypothetical protein [Caudoviricetes sp.]